jgi:hypothetical protein
MACDEHMTDESTLEDLFDRRYSARFAKSDVDDHQVWEPIRSGGYGIGDIALHGADRVTDTLERFSKQSADHCIVFHDQGVQRLHRITSPPAPPSFTQTATSGAISAAENGGP